MKINKQWIVAHESDRELVHEIFGEPTLFGHLFTGPIHKIKNNRIMFYGNYNNFKNK